MLPTLARRIQVTNSGRALIAPPPFAEHEGEVASADVTITIDVRLAVTVSTRAPRSQDRSHVLAVNQTVTIKIRCAEMVITAVGDAVLIDIRTVGGKTEAATIDDRAQSVTDQIGRGQRRAEVRF